MSKSIFYFAYGSNLLAKRMHIRNPRAVRRDIGRLENYRLDFVGFSNNWRGSPATIVSDDNAHTWGAIWEIPEEDIKYLDHQEGVHEGLYNIMNVTVTNPIGKLYNCRVYQQTLRPVDKNEFHELPEVRQPSLLYLKIILKGALESGLPVDYLRTLKTIKHNGYTHNDDELGQAVSDVSVN